MPLLEVEHVTVNFGGLKALSDVSMSVERGKVDALIGPNGAGKTTLFNVVTGFLTPTAGSVKCDGIEITGKAGHKMVSYGISRTFQNIRLIPEMTAIENVRLGHHAKLKQSLVDALFFTPRYRREEAGSIGNAEEILAFVGLGKLKNEKAKNLPYGLQRKLEIARSIATDTEIIMLDEPCAGLNTGEKESLAQLITKINEKYRRTILLIEHDMRFVMNLANNITVLDQGEKIASGPPMAIQKDPAVIRAYLGYKRGRPRDPEN